MNASTPYFLWLPIVAVAAHLVEEFLWPGGFAAWYKWYHPERAWSVTTRFLVTGIVAWSTALQAVVVGVGFHVWSAWNHKRRAAAQI